MPEPAHWKTRALLTYAAISCLGHLLWLTVCVIYLLIWLLIEFEGGPGHWAIMTLGSVAFLTITAANCVTIYFIHHHEDSTSAKLRFITIFTGSLVTIYALAGMFTAEVVLAWCSGLAAALLLPVPIYFARPTTLKAILSLPKDEEIDFGNPW